MFKVQRLSYIGNKETNKKSNNVQLYVNSFFTDKDILTVINLKDRTKTEGVKVHKTKLGHYTYYRVLSSIFSKYTDMECLLFNISKAVRQNVVRKSVGNLDKFLLVSNDEKKDPLLIIVINSKFKEMVSFE